jgi:hypothetical protein
MKLKVSHNFSRPNLKGPTLILDKEGRLLMLWTFPHSVTGMDAFQIGLLCRIDVLFGPSVGVLWEGNWGQFGTMHFGFNRVNGNNDKVGSAELQTLLY